jgi:hypothetical protein
MGSFFDITTGRNHGVIPTADALRIILDSGASLILEKDGGTIRATAKPEQQYRAPVEATEERIDQALSALVGKLVLGESGVEVTEWEVDDSSLTESPDAAKKAKSVRFGWLTVPLFAADETDGGDITRKIIDPIEFARRQPGGGGRIYAIVVRVSGRGGLAGVACAPERLEPPVGATLTARRVVVGTPRVDLPLRLDTLSNVEWGAKSFPDARLRLWHGAVKLKQDAALAGFGATGHHVRLCLLSAAGQELVHCRTGLDAINAGDLDTMSATLGKALELAIDGLAKMRAGKGCEDVTLRMTVVPDRASDGDLPAGAVVGARRGAEDASRWMVRDAEDASR